MAFLKKINSDWQPSEKPDLEVDEIFDFPGPIEALVRGGMAILVDKDGGEIELPGQSFECPICFAGIEGLTEFNAHVSSHLPKTVKEAEVATVTKVEPKAEPKAEETKEAKIRANRLAALEKARAAKAAKVKAKGGK